MNKTTICALKAIIKVVSKRLADSHKPITNRELIGLCRPHLESKIESEKLNDPHIYHEIAEASLNLLIKETYQESALVNQDPQKFLTEIIKPKVEQLPTQTWRSQKQIKFQQFSTPLPVSYLLWHLVNCQPDESILEPSAGTGSLLIWGENTIYCNEIDTRRHAVLEALDITAFNFNAEFIDDFLHPEIRPDCLLMNPPFSSSGGRTANNSSKFGFRHVESALERLRRGGKFGIILGEAGGLDIKTGHDFWRKLSDRFEAKSIIKIDGREYYKNGTTVHINLITGKKLPELRKTNWNQSLNKITNLSVSCVEEAFEKVDEFNLRLDK